MAACAFWIAAPLGFRQAFVPCQNSARRQYQPTKQLGVAATAAASTPPSRVASQSSLSLAKTASSLPQAAPDADGPREQSACLVWIDGRRKGRIALWSVRIREGIFYFQTQQIHACPADR